MSKRNNDFLNLTIQEWKLKVQAELAGLDYNEILVWDSGEGIQVKPVYTSDDMLDDVSPIFSSKDWKIIGEFLNNPDQDYAYLYGFSVKDEFLEKLDQLPEYLDLFFACENPYDIFSKVDFSKLKNLQYLGLDVIGHLAKSGNWFKSQQDDFELAERILENEIFEKSIMVDASVYQNSGANHIQQIAFALAHGVEYIEKFGKKGADKLYFKVAVGGNYFFEIAKLRALRNLWGLILEKYSFDSSTFIFAETSLRNKSLLDIHNNIIRNGLEASSAIQGKADVVQVLPYDEIKGATVFSEELASKQQLLLQKESYFDRFEDSVAGSYFIENLTDLMSKTAFELFQKIESKGGFLSGLLDGSIQKMIVKSSEKEQAAFDEGKMVLIGVNKFRNPNDKIVITEKKKSKIRTKIQPIVEKRLAAKVEKEIK